MSVEDVLAAVPIIDTDSHLIEPADLWTERMSKKWGDLIPYVTWDEATGEDRWIVAGENVWGAAHSATVGWSDPPPHHPPSLEVAEPGAWQAEPRLARMDEYGLAAQLMYPNLIAFHAHAFMRTKDPEYMLESVRAYNDFAADFSRADPDRLLPLSAMPFWDVEACVAEMERCLEMGHRGIVFAPDFERINYPPLASGHWDPLLDAAQSAGVPINFHVGFAAMLNNDDAFANTISEKDEFNRDQYVAECAEMYLSNARSIGNLIMSGLCNRYPRLNFVSVESGFGYVPYLLQSLDWQFHNVGSRRDHPDWELPSEIFRRQIYTTFWFEKIDGEAVAPYADNTMFSSDYPHPTSLGPGPNSISLTPSETVKQTLRTVPDETVAKLLHDNAARVYHLA